MLKLSVNPTCFFGFPDHLLDHVNLSAVYNIKTIVDSFLLKLENPPKSIHIAPEISNYLIKNKNISLHTKHESERVNKPEHLLPHMSMYGYLNNGVTRYGCRCHGTLILVWPKWIQYKIWMKSKPPSNPRFICFELQVPIKNTLWISSNLQNPSDKVRYSSGSCLHNSYTAVTDRSHSSPATGQYLFQSHLLIHTSHTKQQ